MSSFYNQQAASNQYVPNRYVLLSFHRDRSLAVEHFIRQVAQCNAVTHSFVRIVRSPQMSCNRSLLILSVLVFTTPVLGQQHKPAAGRPGPAGGHPGQGHPGQQHHQMMTPQQQMEAEFFQHQMMLMEMMAPRRGGRGHAQGQSASGMNQAGANSRTHPGQMNQARTAQTGSPGANAQQANQASSKKSRQDAAHAKAKEAHRERELAKEKLHETRATTANRSTRAADNLAIGHLKTVHAKLRGADADYDGHRVRAMNHIETAIHHMGSTSGLGVGWGGGFTATGGGHMSQGESDQILRDGIFQLRQTQSSLGTGTNAAAHHRNAHSSINEAIHELEVALKVR
jgi:hypothetical protein